MSPARYGVTSTGFNAPTEAEELALIEADQRANLSSALDLSDQSVLGQVNRIFARRNAEAWTALHAIYDGGDPAIAVADALTSLMKITGTDREGARPSIVLVTVTLQRDTKLEANTHLAQVANKPASRWTPVEDFTAPSDGSFTLLFRATQTGPIDTPVDSITTIVTPVVGWLAITASGEVSLGHDADDEDDARSRREAGLARAGSSTTAAIRADLLGLDTATQCTVFENYTDTTDANGLPPKSFEAVINAVGASDDQVAQVVWQSRSAGIASTGSSSGTAHDGEGNPHVMRFTRPAQVEIWIAYELDGFVGDETFRATIASRLDASIKPGVAVSEWDITTAAHGLGVRLRSVALGLAPAPTSRDEIAIGVRQVARFDAGRIVLT
jgi:hypothetical protein